MLKVLPKTHSNQPRSKNIGFFSVMPQSPQPLVRVATVSAALLALQLSFKWRQLLKRLQARVGCAPVAASCMKLCFQRLVAMGCSSLQGNIVHYPSASCLAQRGGPTVPLPWMSLIRSLSKRSQLLGENLGRLEFQTKCTKAESRIEQLTFLGGE